MRGDAVWFGRFDERVLQSQLELLYASFVILVSVRKVVESYESDVIQRSCRQFEDKIDVDSRKSRFL